MKISLITICYNNEKDIRPTLESVVNQTNQDIEYIVVDGGSTDGTLKIMKEYTGCVDCLISEPDQGIYDAINKGLKAATGDVVGLIHAGDRLYDNTVIEDVVRFFEKNNVDIVYGHSKIVNNLDKVKRVNKSPEYSHNLIKNGWMPSHQSIYCKRFLFEKYGLYRTDLGGIGDYEWFVRYFYHYGDELKIQLLDRFIVRFSLGGVSTSNIKAKLMPSYARDVRKCWTLNDEEPPKCIVWKMFARKVRQYALARII